MILRILRNETLCVTRFGLIVTEQGITGMTSTEDAKSIDIQSIKRDRGEKRAGWAELTNNLYD